IVTKRSENELVGALAACAGSLAPRRHDLCRLAARRGAPEIRPALRSRGPGLAGVTYSMTDLWGRIEAEEMALKDEELKNPDRACDVGHRCAQMSIRAFKLPVLLLL